MYSGCVLLVWHVVWHAAAARLCDQGIEVERVVVIELGGKPHPRLPSQCERGVESTELN